jgi:hypothetical protein
MSLPPEIWSLVISFLPRSSQVNALNVSRTFHDAASTHLFSSVRIYIAAEGAPLAEHWYDSRRDIESAMRISWDILQRIIKSNRFARNVKTFTVLALGGWDTYFEKCMSFLSYFSK